MMHASFKRRVWRLLVAVGSLLRLHPKHHVTFNKVGRLVLAFIAQRSSNNNFFFSPLFSLSITLKDLLALQSCKVILNHLNVLNLKKKLISSLGI
jgi:hypothetical protein